MGFDEGLCCYWFFSCLSLPVPLFCFVMFPGGYEMESLCFFFFCSNSRYSCFMLILLFYRTFLQRIPRFQNSFRLEMNIIPRILISFSNHFVPLTHHQVIHLFLRNRSSLQFPWRSSFVVFFACLLGFVSFYSMVFRNVLDSTEVFFCFCILFSLICGIRLL